MKNCPDMHAKHAGRELQIHWHGCQHSTMGLDRYDSIKVRPEWRSVPPFKWPRVGTHSQTQTTTILEKLCHTTVCKDTRCFERIPWQDTTKRKGHLGQTSQHFQEREHIIDERLVDNHRWSSIANSQNTAMQANISMGRSITNSPLAEMQDLFGCRRPPESRRMRPARNSFWWQLYNSAQETKRK